MLRASILAAALLAACSTPASEAARNDLPSVINADGGEAWLARHLNGRLVLFGRHDADWSNHRLFATRLVDGAWTEPQQVPFTRAGDGKSPHFSPDGRRLYFVSTRPRPEAGANAPPGDLNIWVVSWDGSRWGEPAILPEPINSSADEIDAVEVASGALYFSSTRDETRGRRADLYRASHSGDSFTVEPIEAVDTDLVESTLFVTPDERLLVFSRTDDPSGIGSDDLFYSRRDRGTWSAPIHFGPNVNSPTYEYGPSVSPDGRALYFTSHRTGSAAIVVVDLSDATRR